MKAVILLSVLAQQTDTKDSSTGVVIIGVIILLVVFAGMALGGGKEGD